jgi:hypothetical protein
MAKTPKTSDPFIKQNEEYAKARTTGSAADPYREQRQRQGPGGEGYEKPDFERWTDAELLAHARDLGLVGERELPERDELMRRLDKARTRKP